MANPNEAQRFEEGNRQLVDALHRTIEPLWREVTALIGETSAVAMFQSALQDAKRQHPFLSGVDIDRGGVRLDRLRAHATGLPRATLQAALLAFIEGLESLMADLAGNVVAHKVAPLVEPLKQRLGRE